MTKEELNAKYCIVGDASDIPDPLFKSVANFKKCMKNGKAYVFVSVRNGRTTGYWESEDEAFRHCGKNGIVDTEMKKPAWTAAFQTLNGQKKTRK